MTDEELKDLVASLAVSQKETDRQLKELGKQIGGLGDKFGSFTEGLALPSMVKILSEKFGMEVISPSVRVSKQGEHMEIDVLAYANSEVNEAYVVEVKSHAREESIVQLRNILERFRRFFPEHKAIPSPKIMLLLHESCRFPQLGKSSRRLKTPRPFCRVNL